jgi:hypothetical protein
MVALKAASSRWFNGRGKASMVEEKPQIINFNKQYMQLDYAFVF